MQILEPLDMFRVSPEKAALGECPLWDPRAGRLWWLDCRRGLIHSLHLATGEHQQHEVPAPVGSMAFNQDGRWLLALKDEVVLFDPTASQQRSLGRLEDSHPHLRFNDGAALPDGRFLVGTMHTFRQEGEPPLGGLYVVETDGRLHRVDRGLGVVNGPVTHPITGELFVADSEARQIYAYSHTDESTWSKRTFVNTEPLGSSPDGCCFDAQGGLWTALVRKGQLARFDAQGELTHLVPVPLTHPTSLCFGGTELDELFVTSISDSGRLTAQGELDGHVLRLTGLGFKGVHRPLCNINPA